MNFLAHMSLIVVLDWLIFQYWYVLANRYTVLNFHEGGFLPGRYIISGLVAGALVYWLYLGVVTVWGRWSRRYQSPHGLSLGVAAGLISSIQVTLIVRDASQPPLTLPVTLALLGHLQALHGLMLITAMRLKKHPRRGLVPLPGAGLLFMVGWLFWIGYSFEVTPLGEPQPIIGTPLERYVLGLLLLLLIGIGLLYQLPFKLPLLDREVLLLHEVNLTWGEVIDGFYSAWGLFYLAAPAGHYLLRGYVTAHSNLFPAFLLGFLVLLGWSLGLMWPLIWLNRPRLALWIPRPAFMER